MWISFVQMELISAFIQWKWKTINCCPLSSIFFFFVLEDHITFTLSFLWQKTALLQLFLKWCFQLLSSHFHVLWTYQKICLETSAKNGAQPSVTVSRHSFPTFGHWSMIIISLCWSVLLVFALYLCTDILFSNNCTLSMSSFNFEWCWSVVRVFP